jgi:amino acid permease
LSSSVQPDVGSPGTGRGFVSKAFAIKDVSQLVAATEAEGEGLKRSVGALQLTAMGVGAIIGTGIFVVIGEGAAEAGPAVVLSFVLAAVACVFSALSYAELASAIPVSGSAYTYSYATLGELTAWIIGWDLILEYGVSVARSRSAGAGISTPSSTPPSDSRCRMRLRSPRRTAGCSICRPW